MDSKGSKSFLAVVAASVLSLAATAGEDEVLLDVATNYAKNVSHARCLTAAEAKKTVDEVFAKTPVYQKAGRAERAKRLIDDGMATLVRYEADREWGDSESADKSLKRKTVYKLFKKWMETELPEDDCGGKARIHDRLGAGTDGDEVAVYADGTIETSYGWLPEGTIIDLLGVAESLELAAGAPTNAEEVVVVADVEIVDLASLANLAHVEPEHGIDGEEDESFQHSVRATYSVDMRVRNVLRGKCPFRRFCFSAVHDTANASATGDWLFFRGMTLEVGLARVDGKLKINRFEPVFPYPPYSKEGIRIFRKDSDCGSPFRTVMGLIPADAREYTDWRGLKDDISGSLVALQYGDRELALFASTTNLIEGLYGIFPDYGPSVKITVYGDGESNFDYWRNAWFAESAVTIRSLGEDDGFKRIQETETVAAGICPDLDVLTKELSSIGFADVAGATYAQVSPYPADSDAFCTDEYIKMSGLYLDERLSGNGWIALPKDGISGSLVALQYGDRELALFASTTNLIEGLYGIFPDYGPSVKITVYGDGESNFDYWRNAWFAESAVTIRSLGEDDGFVRTQGAKTVAAGTCPDLDTLTKELSSIGFADVAGATYAQVSPCPADSDASWTDEHRKMSGLDLDERLSGNGWIALPKGGTANAKFLAYGCVWWEARLEPPETNGVRTVSYCKARLARDVVLVCGYVEDAAELKATLNEDRAADILAFALHARQSGFAKESERIASALFAIKESGDAALSGIRKRLAKIAAEYPDFATWEKKELARKEELEKRRKADESDSDAEEEL